jgi:hypothetical protein
MEDQLLEELNCVKGEVQMRNANTGRRGRKRAIIVAAAAVLVVAAGVAYAAWTAGGSGSGYAKAGTAQALATVDVSASTTATLYPGATGDLKLSIDNPNPYPVRITSVSGTSAITSDKGAACDASTGVTFTDQSGLTLDVPASTSATFTLAGSVAMSNASDNSCQGADFTVPVSLSGASNA